MDHPIIAIIGRPNVGKSALFNRLIGKRYAIVDEMEGVTRDRNFATGSFCNQEFTLIDTGGLDKHSPDVLRDQIQAQGEEAIDEASIIIFVVDGKVGITAPDEAIAKRLRRLKKPILLAINKIDNSADEALIHSFHKLGFSSLFPISAIFGYGVEDLLEQALARCPKNDPAPVEAQKKIKLAILGRCNVGKSTLINALLDKERVITSPIPGVTRDSIEIPFKMRGKEYLLIDTAGIRRKKAEREAVEKFAAIRTEETLHRADIVLLLLDAKEGFTTQERGIAADVEAAGKGLILLMNKWDLIHGFRMEHCRTALVETYPYFAHLPMLFISAAKKRNLQQIFPEVERMVASLSQKIPTSALNKWLSEALATNAPPQVKGKRLRIYYMTQVSMAPPTFLLFANSVSCMTDSYKKYLTHSLREAFDLRGLPIYLHLKGKSVKNEEM